MADKDPKEGAPEAQPQNVDVPDNFAEDIAMRIVVIHEKEMDPTISSENVAKFVYENTNGPLLKYFVDATEILVQDEASWKYGSLTWAALIIHSDVIKEYTTFIKEALATVLHGYYELDKPEIDIKRKKYSAYSLIMGNVFSKLIDINNNLYDIIQQIYSELITQEMAKETQEEGREKKTLLRKQTKKKQISKKLYDDIIDYIATQGSFKSSSLNQENPNEYLIVLADRLRGTRRYVMQDIMNQRALERKKQLEKELSERLASAEEIILSSTPFRQGLTLFWKEKRYNYQFLAVEKIRMALQIIGIVIGTAFLMGGYLGVAGLHWFQGIIICAGMWSFIKGFGARKRFKTFYPNDVSKELEACVNNFCGTMRRMSKEQLDLFLMRQIKDKQNNTVIQALPEFVKYLYAVMPDRKSMIITIEELSDLMEHVEIDVAKQLRARFA